VGAEFLRSNRNSSYAPLAANATYTGTPDDLTSFQEITVYVAGAPLVAPGTLTFQFSSNGTDWDVSPSFPLAGPNLSVPIPLRNVLPYFRVIYQNGGTPLTEFRLTTMLHRTGGKALTRFLNQPVNADEPIERVHAISLAADTLKADANLQVGDADVSRGNPVPTVAADGPQLDAFGRLRVSQPKLLLSATPVHDIRADLFDTVVAGGGTVTATHQGSIALAVGTASGDKVQRRGHVLHTYRSGQSMRCNMTFVLPAAKANQTVELGFYDGRNRTINSTSVWGNGVLLRRQGVGEVTLRVVNLDATMGAVVEQPDWNIDPMDGTGPSGITLDWTKAQILDIDLQALYVGRVRVGFTVNGIHWSVHEFLHANVLAVPYLASANLAPWYAIENTGVTASGSTMLQICSEVSREGGAEDLPEVVSISLPVTTSVTLSTSLVSALSFRLWQGFPSAVLRVLALNMLNRSNVAEEWMLLKNPTLAGALAWGGAAAAGTRMVEVSTTSTGVTTVGTVLSGGYVVAGSTGARGGSSNPVSADRDLCGFGIDGTSDIYVLAARAASGGGQDFNCAIEIAEIE
jgi:hypothetical protein